MRDTRLKNDVQKHTSFVIKPPKEDSVIKKVAGFVLLLILMVFGFAVIALGSLQYNVIQ